MKTRLAWTLSLAVLSVSSAWGIPITLTDTGGAAPGSQAGDAFALAAARVGALFNDPINLFFDVGFQTLGPGILGSTNTVTVGATYSSVRAALLADLDPSSPVDAVAVANLPAAPALVFRTNQANGTVILDNDGGNNNSVLDISKANARALGLASATATSTDATIVFSDQFTWDFDPSDGITAGAFDFVGVATHEIMHALGFTSGVDTVDFFTGTGPGGQTDLNPFRIFTTLDLYRYSTQSVGLGAGILDLAVGGTPYFSLDGGATSLGTFSTGQFQGDGRQASHWKDNLGLGIMDPTFAPGELGVITNLDLNALDVIGYNRVFAAVGTPELNLPGAMFPLTFTLLGLLTLFSGRRSASTTG